MLLCKGEEEMANLILLQCSKVVMLWQLMYALFRVQWVVFSLVKDVLLG